MRNWDWWKFCVQVNWLYQIRQLKVPSQHAITPIWWLSNPLGQVIHLISHICLYLPHLSRLLPASLSSSARCKSVWMPHANLPDTLVDCTGVSKYFQMLWGPAAAKQCVRRLHKSILRCSWKQLQLWRCIQGPPSRIVKFWGSWYLCTGMQETSRESEPSVQLCGRPGAVFSQQSLLEFHRQKVFCLSHSSLLQS